MILPSALKLPVAHTPDYAKKKKKKKILLSVGSTFLALLKIVSAQRFIKTNALGGVARSIGTTLTFLASVLYN